MSKQDQALVTILVPVWNEEKHIEESVASVLNQAYDNFELFLIDDGSDDDTLNIIQRLGETDARIKPLKNPRKGKVAAINHAYGMAQGDLFIYFAGDDIMPEDSIVNRVKYLQQEGGMATPNVGYGQLQMVSEDPKFDGQRVPAFGNKGNICGGTIVFNRKFAEKMYPIPETLPNEDTWARLCGEHFCSTLIDVPHVVLFYRIHHGNSHNRFVPFAKMNEFLHIRWVVYGIFRDQFADQLKPEEIEKLTEKAKVEEWRYAGKWGKILFSRLGLREKASVLLNSNSLFYKLKLTLTRLRSLR